MKRFAFIAAAAALALPGLARAATYEIDGVHSNVGFKIKHMMVSWVNGKFGKFSGSFDYDPKNPTALAITASIDADSIDTANVDRDKHLRAPDFFDTAKFKTIEFKSKKATKGKGGALKVTGDLTMHGVTKEVVLDVEGLGEPVKDPFYGVLKTGATATTKVSRKEFGLTWSKAIETGGVVVGDEVTITLDIEATQKPAAAPAAGK
jgi:polyisoprenoid-binding protein YceI